MRWGTVRRLQWPSILKINIIDMEGATRDLLSEMMKFVIHQFLQLRMYQFAEEGMRDAFLYRLAMAPRHHAEILQEVVDYVDMRRHHYYDDV